MKIVPDPKCPYLIIMGAWNPKIFTPFWLRSQGIIQAEEVELELTFGAADYKFLMKFDGVILSISDTHLVLRLSDWNGDKLVSLEKTALTILNCLHHTPLKAIGANFDFQIEEPTPSLLNFFKTPSQVPLNDLAYAASSLEISHTFAIPDVADGVTLRLLDTGKSYEAKVNFHKATGNAAEAIAWLTDKLPKFHACGMDVLSAFDLKPSNDDHE